MFLRDRFLMRWLLVVLLGCVSASYAVMTNGIVVDVTAKGIGSNQPTAVSLSGACHGRCTTKCIRSSGCAGVNVREQANGMVTCEFKHGLYFDKYLTSMPEIQYIKVKEPPRSCADVYEIYGETTSGVYEINISPSSSDPDNIVSVYCDMVTDGGKWMVLIRRIDGNVSFDRSWSDYLQRFGDLEGNLWMGLDFMHNVTMNMGLSYEMRVDMTSFPRYVNGDFVGPVEQGYAKYSTFSVDGPESFYRLSVSGFSGNWGDSMAVHNGMMFTARGTQNDHDRNSNNCAELFLGAWWYNDCSDARLTGEYGMIVEDVVVKYFYFTKTFYHGILWETYLGNNEHPQFIEMKIRPI